MLPAMKTSIGTHPDRRAPRPALLQALATAQPAAWALAGLLLFVSTSPGCDSNTGPGSSESTADASPENTRVAPAKDSGPRPNIVMFLTEQHSYLASSLNGNPFIHTPNMERLTARGVSFERTYTSAPLCSPARASLLTGRLPHSLNVNVNARDLPADVPNLGQLLRAQGYSTHWIGKWHLARAYPKRGITELPGFTYIPFEEQVQPLSGELTDALVIDKAVEFLSSAPAEPFLLVVSLRAGQDIQPWVGAALNKGMGDPLVAVDQQPQLPANAGVPADDLSFVQLCRSVNNVRANAGPDGAPPWDETEWGTYLHTYYRLIETMDASMGQVLDELEQQGLYDDAMIIMTSDHGEGLAAHGWVGKEMFYEEIMRVPFLMSWPGVFPSGRRDARLVSQLDLIPSLCDALEIPRPDGLEGTDLFATLDQQELELHPVLVGELMLDGRFKAAERKKDHRGRMVLTGRYKYMTFTRGRQWQLLFDLEADPGEMNNLVDDPAWADVLEQHREILKTWMARTDDDFRMR
jgi:arylsulfatase A-like enzyme